MEGVKRMEEESMNGKGLGFNGKQCIHPSQVEIAQRAFAPGRDEVEWAVKIVLAGEKADALGRGAWGFEGKMIDRPVIGKSKAVIERARACGVDIKALEEEFNGVQPE